MLRKDDAELVGVFRQALNIDLPERVEIESVDSSWRSDLKVKLPDGALMEIPVFEALYEFYRPSVWDRLANEA